MKDKKLNENLGNGKTATGYRGGGSVQRIGKKQTISQITGGKAAWGTQGGFRWSQVHPKGTKKKKGPSEVRGGGKRNSIKRRRQRERGPSTKNS